jgi:DNA helicase-2/ATP-dependent DNA helicase PcrA
VRNNAARKEKKLWTDRKGGAPVVVVQAHDEHHEAERRARDRAAPARRRRDVGTRRGRAAWTNAQSRDRGRVPGFGLAYQVVGGVSFMPGAR